MIEFVAIIASHIFLLTIMLRAVQLARVEDELDAETKTKKQVK